MRRGILLSLVASAQALTMSGWGTKAWNWGSAVGDAHDAAATLRGALREKGARVSFLKGLREGTVSEADATLAFALTCQRAARAGLPEGFDEAYKALVAGSYESGDGLSKLARTGSSAVERYNLMVQLKVKPERRDEFLEIIWANTRSTLNEPRNLRYCWGESATEPNTFHFQESFVGKRGFEEHCATATFAAWEKFTTTDPFSEEPSVQFYVPTTSVSDDHAPSAVVAACLATMEFAELGC